MKNLLIATGNDGKVREIQEILKDLPFEFAAKESYAEETGVTFVENARIKAHDLAELTGKITLADDSGLSVDALGGRPGVFSKRYGPSDAARIIRLLDELKGIDQRAAHFTSAVVVYDPENQKEYVAEGRVDGIIVDQPVGTNGFGYDPIFYCPELAKTFGEASAAEKNQVSHRARALALIKQQLSDLFFN